MKKRIYVSLSLDDSLSLPNQIWSTTQQDISSALEGIGAEDVIVYGAGKAEEDITFSIHVGNNNE